MGRMERLTDSETSLSMRQMIQATPPRRERERDAERQCSPNGAASGFTTCGFGVSEQTQANRHRTDLYQTDIRERDDGEQTRETASMVADDYSRGKLQLLDKQLLSGEAADTHTHTSADRSSHTERRTEQNCLSDGCGCTDSRSAIPDLLAMALPQQPSGRRTEAYNPDSRIADFENGEAALEWMIGAYS